LKNTIFIDFVMRSKSRIYKNAKKMGKFLAIFYAIFDEISVKNA